MSAPLQPRWPSRQDQQHSYRVLHAAPPRWQAIPTCDPGSPSPTNATSPCSSLQQAHQAVKSCSIEMPGDMAQGCSSVPVADLTASQVAPQWPSQHHQQAAAHLAAQQWAPGLRHDPTALAHAPQATDLSHMLAHQQVGEQKPAHHQDSSQQHHLGLHMQQQVHHNDLDAHLEHTGEHYSQVTPRQTQQLAQQHFAAQQYFAQPAQASVDQQHQQQQHQQQPLAAKQQQSWRQQESPEEPVAQQGDAMVGQHTRVAPQQVEDMGQAERRRQQLGQLMSHIKSRAISILIKESREMERLWFQCARCVKDSHPHETNTRTMQALVVQRVYNTIAQDESRRPLKDMLYQKMTEAHQSHVAHHQQLVVNAQQQQQQAATATSTAGAAQALYTSTSTAATAPDINTASAPAAAPATATTPNTTVDTQTAEQCRQRHGGYKRRIPEDTRQEVNCTLPRYLNSGQLQRMHHLQRRAIRALIKEGSDTMEDLLRECMRWVMRCYPYETNFPKIQALTLHRTYSTIVRDESYQELMGMLHAKMREAQEPSKARRREGNAAMDRLHRINEFAASTLERVLAAGMEASHRVDASKRHTSALIEDSAEMQKLWWECAQHVQEERSKITQEPCAMEHALCELVHRHVQDFLPQEPGDLAPQCICDSCVEFFDGRMW